jgi:hypothetical protein
VFIRVHQWLQIVLISVHSRFGSLVAALPGFAALCSLRLIPTLAIAP